MDTQQLLQKLDSFRDLPPNWNGYDAQPVSSDALQAATEFAHQHTEPEWECFATATGTVQFENDKLDILAEVFADRVEYSGPGNKRWTAIMQHFCCKAPKSRASLQSNAG